MPEQTTSQGTGKPVLFHPLVYLEDGDDVTIGRADIDSYAVFPPDGAQLVRWLEGRRDRRRGRRPLPPRLR